MTSVRGAVNRFVLRVREGGASGTNEAAVRSLIGPVFASLGYDGADLRMDSVVTLGSLAVSIHGVGGVAADAGIMAAFAADPGLSLGIVIVGSEWRFFTDLDEPHVMDPAPFARWDVIADHVPPLEVLTQAQKSRLDRARIHAVARQERAQERLLADITTLLSPSSGFTKLAIAGVCPEAVADGASDADIDGWKPAVANALRRWAKQQTQAPPSIPTDVTEKDLKAFEMIRSLIGADKAIAFEDSGAYFKIHLAEKATWVFIRLLLDHGKPQVQVPLPFEQVTRLANGLTVSTPAATGWTAVDFESTADMGQLGDLFRAAYQAVKHVRTAC